MIQADTVLQPRLTCSDDKVRYLGGWQSYGLWGHSIAPFNELRLYICDKTPNILWIYNNITKRFQLSIKVTISVTTLGYSLFVCGTEAHLAPCPPHSWGFWITHNDATYSVGLLWTSYQLVAETSTWQQKNTTDKHPCPRQDSNPQCQQASGRRPTP